MTEVVEEVDKVLDWRTQWLRVHYQKVNAIKIAKDTSIDLHFAIDLRKNCTNEDLCMRILYGSE